MKVSNCVFKSAHPRKAKIIEKESKRIDQVVKSVDTSKKALPDDNFAKDIKLKIDKQRQKRELVQECIELERRHFEKR